MVRGVEMGYVALRALTECQSTVPQYGSGSAYFLAALPDSSASLPLPLLFVRGRLGVDVEEDG